jgi:DNA repair photolyase
VPFDWTLNPYRGCEHGCIYCFARPYHEYLGFSCGLDFETKLVAKPDAAKLLKRELASPKWKPEPIVMSASTDIYQPIEHQMGIARQCLKVLADCGQPVTTMTKSALVLRENLEVLHEFLDTLRADAPARRRQADRTTKRAAR